MMTNGRIYPTDTKKIGTFQVKRLYKDRIKIKNEKFDHLQQHYDNVPHDITNKSKTKKL